MGSGPIWTGMSRTLHLGRALLCALAIGLLVAPAALAARPPIALGVNIDDAPGNAGKLDSYTRLVGAKPAIVMWYQSWSEPLYYSSQAAAVADRQITPMITWEPADGDRGIPLSQIIAGARDDYIRQSADAARAFGRPMLIRLAHEMNLQGSPWAAGRYGNTPAKYVAAWRHVVSIFRSEGVTNVQWVWSPNVDWGDAPFSAYFPGDAWVDWVGLDGYNWGTQKQSGWRSLGQVFGSSYDRITRLSDKPVMIAETAAPERGGDKAAWIRHGFLRDIPNRLPRVRAAVWFDRTKETDWRVNSSSSALAAFREVAASPLYGGIAKPRVRARLSFSTRCRRHGHRPVCATVGRVRFPAVAAGAAAPSCKGRVKVVIRLGHKRFRSKGTVNRHCRYRAKTKLAKNVRKGIRRARVSIRFSAASAAGKAGPKRVKLR